MQPVTKLLSTSLHIAQALSEFYRTEEGNPGRSGRWLLVADKDEGKLLPPGEMRLAGLRAWTANQVDRVRGMIRGRPPVVHYARTLDLAVPGPVRISNWHQTAVVFRKDCVDKLYFRDQEYQAALNIAVATYTNSRIVATGRVLCVRQPRLIPSPVVNSPGEIFSVAADVMSDLQSALLGSEAIAGRLSIRAKVAAIADVYDTPPDKRTAFEAVARELDEVVEKTGTWACHGDLWPQNVMADDAGRPRLIDFDKVLGCTRVFDPWYYLLMTRGAGDPHSLRKVMTPDDPARGAARAEIDAWAARTGRPSVTEAEHFAALGTYALLKATEYECRQGRPGACLQWLAPIISAFVPRCLSDSVRPAR